MEVNGGKSMYPSTPENPLDVEWVKLIGKAKALGLTKEEIRHFLNMTIDWEEETANSDLYQKNTHNID